MRNATRRPQAVCRRFSSWAAWTTRGRTRRSSRAPIVARTRGMPASASTWSLWDGGRTDAEVAQAPSCLEAARERLQSSIPHSASRCVSARSRSSPAAAAVAAATSGVTAAAEARRVVDERYRAGVIAQHRGARRGVCAAPGATRSDARAGHAFAWPKRASTRALGR